METARYGRMELGRCINYDLGKTVHITHPGVRPRKSCEGFEPPVPAPHLPLGLPVAVAQTRLEIFGEGNCPHP